MLSNSPSSYMSAVPLMLFINSVHERLALNTQFGFCHSPADIRASAHVGVSGSERE